MGAKIVRRTRDFPQLWEFGSGDTRKSLKLRHLKGIRIAELVAYFNGIRFTRTSPVWPSILTLFVHFIVFYGS